MKNSYRNTIRVSNSLDPDQARQNFGPDLGPNCLHMLSVDDTSRQLTLHSLGAKDPTFFIFSLMNLTLFASTGFCHPLIHLQTVWRHIRNCPDLDPNYIN